MGIPNLVLLNNVVCYPGQRIFITEGISLNQKGSLCPSRVNFRVNNPINFPWPSSHVNGRKWLIKITRFLLQCHPDSRTTWLFEGRSVGNPTNWNLRVPLEIIVFKRSSRALISDTWIKQLFCHWTPSQAPDMMWVNIHHTVDIRPRTYRRRSIIIVQGNPITARVV